MNSFLIQKTSMLRQFLVVVVAVCFVTTICFVTFAQNNYKLVAFVFLFAVSLIAMLFNILPSLLAAFLSGAIWNFFFIPPRFTLHLISAEDTILLLMYFVIVFLNAGLARKIRQFEKIASQKEESVNRIKLYHALINPLSHELKTPIAAIVGAADNLESNNLKLTAENRKELLEEILKATLRLDTKLEDLSKHQDGKRATKGKNQSMQKINN